MGIQSANQGANEAFTPKVVEIEVPGDAAIFYFEGGVKTAIEFMEQSRKFLENCGDIGSVAKLNDALSSMNALLDVTREAKAEIITQAQRTTQTQASQSGDEQEPGVQAGFVPKIKTDDDGGSRE